MGKYSVGQRVRDPDGDLCEIIGKPTRGFREIRILGGKHDGLTFELHKSSLEPVTACPETSEKRLFTGQ